MIIKIMLISEWNVIKVTSADKVKDVNSRGQVLRDRSDACLRLRDDECEVLRGWDANEQSQNKNHGGRYH